MSQIVLIVRNLPALKHPESKEKPKRRSRVIRLLGIGNVSSRKNGRRGNRPPEMIIPEQGSKSRIKKSTKLRLLSPSDKAVKKAPTSGGGGPRRFLS